MKCYYLCEIHGDGDIDAEKPWTPTTGPFRPACYVHGASITCSEILIDERGRPRITHCVAVLDLADHGALDGRKGVERLPDEPFDRLATALSEESKARVSNATKVEQRAGESYGDVLRKVVPNFDESSFSIDTETADPGPRPDEPLPEPLPGVIVIG